MDRRKTLGIVTACGLTTMGLVLSTLAFSNHSARTRLKASDYTLTLNANNGISGTAVTTTQSITTDSGAYQVEFGYTNCSALSNGHATILAGGSIVNNDHIRSIHSLTADFETSGELKFRTSYDGATWGGYTTMVDEQEYEFGSYPYYVEFTTDGTNPVSLKSVQFAYTCLENPAAHEGETGESSYQKVTADRSDWTGTYLIVYENGDGAGYAFNGAASSLDSYGNNVSVTISDGKIATSSELESADVDVTLSSGSEYYIQTSTSNYIGGTSGTNDLYYSTSKSDVEPSTISIGEDGLATILSNDSHMAFNLTNNAYQFRYFKASSSCVVNVCLYRLVDGADIEAPVDENGFTAVDANKNSYNTNSIFDSDNGLTVKATFSDGSTQTLSKGSDGYSYVVKNSSGVAIDTSAAFPAEGIYTLIVSYKNYIPVEIQLNVGVYTYLTGVTASMTTVAFNTADVLSNNLDGNLTAQLLYNVSSLNKSVAYSQFSANNLTITLSDPNGVAHDISTAFATAGTWTVKVSSTEDETLFDTISLTVSAIQVTDISLSNTDLVVYVGKTAQLTATVNPTNATNQGIAWSSSDETVATVDENGLVAGVKVGTATITATSSDGGKTATCDITVKKQSMTTATITANNPSTSGSTECTFSTSGFTTSGITLTGGSFTKAFPASDGSYKMGASKSGGEIVFEFDPVVITGITLTANYYEDANVKITTSADSTGETVNVTADGDYATTAFASNTAEVSSITLTNSGSKNRYYFVALTITCGVADPIYPTAITLTDTKINVGYTAQLTPTFSPSDTNQTALTWSSSNTNVATVDQTGLVTAKAAGTTTIYAVGKDENDNDVTGSCKVTVSTIAVTGVSLDRTTTDLTLGSSVTLTATVSPTNATNKNVSWSSSNTSVATVTSGGVVTGAGLGTATITATTADGGKTATCTITVVEEQIDDYTIMIYMCGADLESDNGLATGDLAEIFNVTGQPDGVNIIVETGGASKWKNYGISSNYLTRYHVANRALVQDTTLTKASMGLTSTFQSFLEWGMTEYPAQRTGVIMWNHGGALDGCCFDQNYSNDPLTNSEANSAYAGAFNSVGRTDPLEWIGYDCCLMAEQDIAEFNSHYFNYMVASEETEGGYGWDYDGGWLKNLYNDPSGITTSSLLTQIVDTFIAENSEESTLSALDLTKMSTYKTAWENLAAQLKSTVNSSTKWSTFATMVNQCTKYGYDSSVSSYNDGYSYDIFDVQNFITRGESSYSALSSYWTSLQSAFDDLVIHNATTSDYSSSYGLTFFCPISGYNETSYYSTSVTNFTTWRSFVQSYGNWY